MRNVNPYVHNVIKVFCQNTECKRNKQIWLMIVFFLLLFNFIYEVIYYYKLLSGRDTHLSLTCQSQ